MKRHYFLCLINFYQYNWLTQFVGIGTTTADACSVLKLKRNNKGFLPPRMNASEKGSIHSPKR